MKTFDSKNFTYTEKTRTFVAEASTLCVHGAENFYIKSARTGATKLFLLQGVDMENEDVAGYRFFSPGANLFALIIND